MIENRFCFLSQPHHFLPCYLLYHSMISLWCFVAVSFVSDLFLHSPLMHVFLCRVTTESVCVCYRCGCVCVCVTMLPRRPGGFLEVLVVVVAPWPLSASKSACVIPSMASLSLLAVSGALRVLVVFRVLTATCRRRKGGVSSLTIICCCRS